MTDGLRAFVNEQAVSLPAGADALAAVTAFDPAVGARVAAGEGYLTDGRGVRLPPDTVLAPGAILRVILSSRKAADADA